MNLSCCWGPMLDFAPALKGDQAFDHFYLFFLQESTFQRGLPLLQEAGRHTQTDFAQKFKPLSLKREQEIDHSH